MENRKRERKGLKLVEPLYSLHDAEHAVEQIETLEYGEGREILPGIKLWLRDAEHILGSCLTELEVKEHGAVRKLVYSGDLGQPDTPLLPDPAIIKEADLVLLESTYGDRLH